MELNPNLPQKLTECKPVPPLWRIASEVVHKYGLTFALLRARRRTAQISGARFEYCYRAATETTSTYAQIGRVVLIDRTSVAYAVIRHATKFNLPLPPGCNWLTVAARVKAVRSQKPVDTSKRKLVPSLENLINEKLNAQRS